MGLGTLLVGKIDQTLAGVARPASVLGGETVLVVPLDETSTVIRLELAPGECHLYFGGGAHVPLALEDEEDADTIVDRVVAITRGDAFEGYSYVDGTLVRTAEIYGHRGNSLVGETGQASVRRRARAWEPRPTS